MKKWINWLCPAVFLLVIFAGAILFFALPRQDYSVLEKRYLQETPEITLKTLEDGTAQTNLEKYLADHFPGRDGLVGINAYWKLLTGRNAVEKIYYAKDGYLINAPTALDLELFTTTLQRFDNFAKTTGLPASLLMVPSTGSMKGELLPLGARAYPDDVLYETAEKTLTEVKSYDLRDALSKADQSGQVFYRTDHHLTAYGSYSLYAAWREARGQTVTPREDYEVTSFDGFYGTTWSGSGYFLTPPDTVELWDLGLTPQITITDAGEEPITSESFFFRSHLNALDKYPVYLDGNHTITKIVNPDAPEGTLLVIKDSYAHAVAPFLSENYRTVYLLDLRFYRGSVSSYAKEIGADELLYLYGTSSLLTDTNSAWLF